jgi:hypothetical protein
MTSYLRRSVDMGVSGVYNPGLDQDYRVFNNASYYTETNTTWAKFWAPWAFLQPSKNYMPDDPASPAYQSFLQFDDQINQARANGLNIIINSWTVPEWANGAVDSQGAPLTGQAEILYMKEDRMNQADYQAWYKGGTYSGPKPDDRKGLHFKFPSDLTTTGPWAKWIGFLVNRYRDLSGGRLGVIEIINEPNLQMFPLFNANSADPWSPGTDYVVNCALVQMFSTAQAVNASYGYPAWIMGPATDDRYGPANSFESARASTRLRMRYDDFVNNLLGTLEGTNFVAHSKTIWSHHNYTDVEFDMGDFTSTGNGGNRAADVRRRLVNRWAGVGQAPGVKSNPLVFISEGGARSNVIQDKYPGVDWEQKQRDLVRHNWQRHVQDSGDGLGIGMISNYLFHSQTTFDSGLRTPLFAPGGDRARPSYDYWKTLPRFR